MSEYGKRVKSAMLHANINQPSLAKLAGIAQPSLNYMLKNAKRPSSANAKIAVACGVSARWLATGEGKMVGGNVVNAEPANAKKGQAPLISNIQAGSWSEGIDEFHPNDAETWHPKPVGGDNSYYLRVKGDSMTSPVGDSFPEGMLILIDPDAPWVNGSFVVAKINGENGVTFKQLKYDESDRPYLKPLNPSEHFQNIYDEFRILGKMVFSGNFY